MNINRRGYWGTGLTLGLVIIVLAVSLWPRQGPDINCSAAVLYPHLSGNYSLDGGVGLNLEPDYTGSISFSGELTPRENNGHPLNLLRIIYFNYRVDNHGFLTLSKFEVHKNISDNVDDTLFNHTVFDFSAATRRVRVTELFPNAWMVGNAFSPIFTCVNK